MSTLSHGSADRVSDTRKWSALIVRETWASLAITAMWAVVAISAVWGPDFVSTSGSGTTSTTIPSGIAVAVFATIGTWVVAKYGFGRSNET
ncbi:MAG TPA: hypothetical protein VGF10_02900 [Gaiella sp.]